jgi:hypothetical protein
MHKPTATVIPICRKHHYLRKMLEMLDFLDMRVMQRKRGGRREFLPRMNAENADRKSGGKPPFLTVIERDVCITQRGLAQDAQRKAGGKKITPV